MLQNIFDNNLVAIGKNKVDFTLKKPAYGGMCILELRKVLMYEFHYDYIKNKYCYEYKYMKILGTIKECLILVIIWLIQNTMMIQTN